MINFLQPCVYVKHRLNSFSQLILKGLKLLSRFFAKLIFKTKSTAYSGFFLRTVQLLP